MMTRTSRQRRLPHLTAIMLAFGLALAGLLGAAALPQASAFARVVVMVNGEPITTLDIEQRSKLLQLTTRKTPSREEVLEQLIGDKLKIHEAAKFKLTASDTEVENTFAGMASRMGANPKQLEAQLASAGAGAGTLKARIKADLVWNQLVRGRFQASLQVGEKDILGALEAKNKEDTGSFDYTLRPILFIVPRGSAPGAFDARRREAEALRGRFKDCEEGVRFARSLRDTAVRTAVHRTSADLPAQLRDVLNKMQVGQLTPPEQTAQGIEVFALCAKRASVADSPVRREARDELVSERFKVQSDRYLKQIRRSAMIEFRQ
jgi:peptidyl-prolyl cis-trans isomerase SurA